MNIFISKNGIQLGPYSVADAQKELASGHLVDSDFAWYEGLAGWIPLSQVPGMALPATPVNPPAYPPLPRLGEAPPDPGLLWRRLATAFVIFVISFVFFFVVIFLVVMVIGGAVSGAEASAAAHAHGYEEGSKFGREAGEKFGREYSGVASMASALGSLVLSLIAGYWMAFSGLFPWCKPKRIS